MAKSRKDWMDERQKIGVGLLAGIAAGFGIAWLLYSEKGQEFREDAKGRIGDVSGKVGDVSRTVADSVTGEIDKLKNKVSDTFREGRIAAAERLSDAERSVNPRKPASEKETKSTKSRSN